MADPLWINASAGAPAYSAAELRQAMALALMYDGRNMGGRTGVRPGGNQLQVSLAGSTITVQPGVLCIDPGLSTPQGPYWVAIPVAETPGPLTAADATNPRKDVVIARVYDHDEDVSGLRLARTEYLAGTPNPSPSEPAVPAGATRLASIDVPKVGSGSPVVTDRRLYTAAAGGIVPVAAAGDIASAVPGRYRHRLDTGQLEQDTGSGWRRADWFSAWGRVVGQRDNAGAASLSAVNGSAEAVTNLRSGSAQCIAGRSYKIHMAGRAKIGTAGTDLTLRVREEPVFGSPTGTVRGYSTEIAAANTTGIYSYAATGYYDATSTGAVSFVLTSQTAAGGISWYHGDASTPVVAEVIDVGPTALTVV